MLLRLILIFLTLTHLQGLQAKKRIIAEQRIIGGHTPDGSVSWVVYLFRNGSFLSPEGTGAIISPYHILTSSRNMVDSDTNQTIVGTYVSFQ